MNKKLTISITSLALFAIVAFMFYPAHQPSQYQPRMDNEQNQKTFKGAAEYLNALRANQLTGVVNQEDVDYALAQTSSFRKNFKAAFPLNWQNAGPDNIGGRTRAILIDRNNNNILYAGGVNGGLFKSTNKGASWNPINDQFENMTISSLCQTPNGNIYFGTGESFTGAGGQEAYTAGFPGGGIYKSTDGGKTFDRIPTTKGYTYVNKVAAHPTKNVVLAATTNGLYSSTDGDDTKWTLVLSYSDNNFADVIIDKNGTAFACSNRVFRSTDPTANGSYKQSTGIAFSPNPSRIALAVSASDPNYVYALCVGQVTFTGPSGPITVGSGLIGLYQAKDNGVEFAQIVGKASAYFAPFTHTSLGSSQGNYDIALAVHPKNSERVFIGGVQFAEWTKTGGPVIVGNTFDSPFNPFGIHADKHTIVFDTVSNPIIMYIGSDGGVTKTTNAALTNYTAINNGYQTTAFYGIAAGIDGTVMGGTQDNGTLLVNGKGNTKESGVEVMGGDGFKCQISQRDPKIVFAQTYNGNMGRSLNQGGNMGAIWDDRIKEFFFKKTEPYQPSNIFNSPIHLWESRTNEDNRLFYPLDNEVWMAKDATNSPNPQWFRLAKLPTDPHSFEGTPDGNSLFVSGLNGSTIYRIDGLNKTVWDTAKFKQNTIPDSVTLTSIKGNLPGRTITDIEVDETNPNRVIVTMGNYGNTSFIYVSENALSASPTWRSIQGSLPSFPVYDAEISVENPNHIILGTEYGIYACTNGLATTPTWVENNMNFPLVAVFEMRQVENKYVPGTGGWRTGPMLYAGTHGRGIFKTGNLLTGIKPINNQDNAMLVAYPNPAVNQVNLNLPSSLNGSISIQVLNYTGQVVISSTKTVGQGNNNIQLNTSALRAGNYLIRIEGTNYKASSKFVKMD